MLYRPNILVRNKFLHSLNARPSSHVFRKTAFAFLLRAIIFLYCSQNMSKARRMNARAKLPLIRAARKRPPLVRTTQISESDRMLSCLYRGKGEKSRDLITNEGAYTGTSMRVKILYGYIFAGRRNKRTYSNTFPKIINYLPKLSFLN